MKNVMGVNTEGRKYGRYDGRISRRTVALSGKLVCRPTHTNFNKHFARWFHACGVISVLVEFRILCPQDIHPKQPEVEPAIWAGKNEMQGKRYVSQGREGGGACSARLLYRRELTCLFE
ncbi:hypothetical protein DPMN_092702 [Dreissena polymorpha]|uniref:Uncharacterized protein n=1 Tax=Dreissena polymorpha TaxID=45954 RepID=A0A9D4L2Y2_DREPO|nr:hypothetical protein DPMN_092702 [Dreissena polymorpha]